MTPPVELLVSARFDRELEAAAATLFFALSTPKTPPPIPISSKITAMMMQHLLRLRLGAGTSSCPLKLALPRGELEGTYSSSGQKSVPRIPTITIAL